MTVVLTVAVHAMSLLLGLQKTDHDSPQNHMMTTITAKQINYQATVKRISYENI